MKENASVGGNTEGLFQIFPLGKEWKNQLARWRCVRLVEYTYNKATLHGGSKADTKAESTFLPPRKEGKKRVTNEGSMHTTGKNGPLIHA